MHTGRGVHLSSGQQRRVEMAVVVGGCTALLVVLMVAPCIQWSLGSGRRVEIVQRTVEAEDVLVVARAQSLRHAVGVRPTQGQGKRLVAKHAHSSLKVGEVVRQMVALVVPLQEEDSPSWTVEQRHGVQAQRPVHPRWFDARECSELMFALARDSKEIAPAYSGPRVFSSGNMEPLPWRMGYIFLQCWAPALRGPRTGASATTLGAELLATGSRGAIEAVLAAGSPVATAPAAEVDTQGDVKLKYHLAWGRTGMMMLQAANMVKGFHDSMWIHLKRYIKFATQFNRTRKLTAMRALRPATLALARSLTIGKYGCQRASELRVCCPPTGFSTIWTSDSSLEHASADTSDNNDSTSIFTDLVAVALPFPRARDLGGRVFSASDSSDSEAKQSLPSLCSIVVSLSVQTQIKPIRGACNVSTFDFGSSALYDQSISVKKPFLEPSSLADQVVGATLFGGQPISPTSPCAGNCSYLTSINAPAFSCTLGFKNTSVLEWERGIVSDYPVYISGRFDAALPLYPLYNNWDYEGHYANYGNVLNLSAGTNVTCISYNATYHLNYTFTGPISSVVIKQVVLDQPGSQLMLGTMADRAGPAASDPDFVDGERQTHSAWFNTTTNYYAVLSSLYSFLVGNITTDESGDSLDLVYQPPRLAVTQSRLVTFIQNVNITWGDVPTAMESLLNNITLSLLTIDLSQSATATCVYTDSHPYFSYDAEQLWLVYGLALVVALLCDALGVFALVQIRVGPVNAEFSDFLAATRNAELDDVDVSEGSQPVRLRYGLLKDEAGRHAFSLAENIGPVGDETRGQGIRDGSIEAGKGYQMEPLMYSPVKQLSDSNSPSSRAYSQGPIPHMRYCEVDHHVASREPHEMRSKMQEKPDPALSFCLHVARHRASKREFGNTRYEFNGRTVWPHTRENQGGKLETFIPNHKVCGYKQKPMKPTNEVQDIRRKIPSRNQQVSVPASEPFTRLKGEILGRRKYYNASQQQGNSQGKVECPKMICWKNCRKPISTDQA
ncbi:hypothetical protein C8R44DRAFT_901543 [Mycena epipterygia]|nr:hypothetical protein C8R44DRAFT_901543 [Mycena epipterygia]